MTPNTATYRVFDDEDSQMIANASGAEWMTRLEAMALVMSLDCDIVSVFRRQVWVKLKPAPVPRIRTKRELLGYLVALSFGLDRDPDHTPSQLKAMTVAELKRETTRLAKWLAESLGDDAVKNAKRNAARSYDFLGF